MAEIFNNGFEEGDFSAWDNTGASGATVTVVGSPTHHGSHACQVAGLDVWNEWAFPYVDIGGLSEAYTRGYFLFKDTLPTAPDTFFPCSPRLAGNGGINYTVVIPIRDFGNNKWGIQYRSGGAFVTAYEAGTSTVLVDTWYCLEVHAIIGAGTGEVELWVDNVPKVSISDIDNSDRVNIKYLTSGCAYLAVAEPAARTVLQDCVVAADARIYCEAAGQQLFTLINQEDY